MNQRGKGTEDREMNVERLNNGISVIICCYNSDWIIERTLEALKKQEVSSDLAWEIILVDNCCTDNTVAVARKVMQGCDIDFNIVSETKPGLANARKKGVSVAKYDIVIYCDDDNLLSEHYIMTMHDIMRSDVKVGAAGGIGIAEYQVEPAQKVKDNPGYYALGSQMNHDCWLFGAGVTLRTALVREVYNNQRCYLMGRKGGELLSGDDSELVMSMVLRGYKISPTDDVSFTHVLKANRLTEEYFERLLLGLVRPVPVFEVFRMVIYDQPFKELLNKYYMCYRAYLGSWVHLTRPDRLITRKKYGDIIAKYEYWGIFTLWRIYREWKKIKRQVR